MQPANQSLCFGTALILASCRHIARFLLQRSNGGASGGRPSAAESALADHLTIACGDPASLRDRERFRRHAVPPERQVMAASFQRRFPRLN
ncbi:MAG: hypothetical protein ACXIVF_02700 [Rhizobiaceae bacterium]